jgi:hypothetical protein
MRILLVLANGVAAARAAPFVHASVVYVEFGLLRATEISPCRKYPGERAGGDFFLEPVMRHRGPDNEWIVAYRAVLLRDRVGLGLTVFVGVKIEGHASDRAEAFQEAIIAMPEIIACHLVAGDIDYLLEVVVPDLKHYQHYLVDKLLNLSIIREVRSNIAIQTLKAAAPLPLDHLVPARTGRPDR